MYNKDIIEREGLRDPYELYLEGNSTWDAVTEYGLQITRDEDGKIVFSANSPAYIEAFQQIYEWRSVQQIVQSHCSFTNEKSLFGFSALSFDLGNYLNLFNFEWGILPFPKGPSADKHYWTVQALNTTVIPKNAKDPEGLAALRAFLWRDDDIMLNDMLAGHAKNEESAHVFITGNQEWEGQASRLFQPQLGEEFGTYANEIYAGQRSATAGMAEIEPIIQGRLDELFKQ